MRRYKKGDRSGRGGGAYRGRGGAGARQGWDGKTPDTDPAYKSERQKAKEREERDAQDAELDSKFGFESYLGTEPRTAFLFNIRASSLVEASGGPSSSPFACLDCYFVCEDGSTFKAAVQHLPYFYVLLRHCSASDFLEAETYLMRRFEGLLLSVSLHEMEDLALPNHLSGLKRSVVRLSFRNVADMLSVRNRLLPVIQDNKRRDDNKPAAFSLSSSLPSSSSSSAQDSQSLRQRRKRDEILDALIDIREYDVPYVTRVAIDLHIRVGCWYDVRLIPSSSTAAFSSPALAHLSAPSSSSSPSFSSSAASSYLTHALIARPELLTPPHLKKCTFDIETTKSPLKFPNAALDHVMMISLMMDGAGFLIVNRDIVGADIADFEYSPTAEMQGVFSCINVAGEKELLQAFFALVRQHRPLVFITYNGDFFDWPFLAARCSQHGLSLLDEVGVYQRDDEFVGKAAIHLDCFCWVKRDSYLPQGSQGLKAVTRAKLKYNPVEVDPEQMLRLAAEQPQQLAAYSVSDAVSTFYLYLKFIHLFVFSLSTIVPMAPADVLRKGSGTLCESLLQVQAGAAGILCPNKQEDDPITFHRGRLLDSETYIGGHVECIESGVFRSDIPVRFKLAPERLRRLRAGIHTTLTFAVEREHGRQLDELINGADVEGAIGGLLDALLQQPSVECLPLIYHLDVGAMYPNIILTNRLQPMAMVDDAACAACDFNVDGSNCQRRMEWKWRGKMYPATRGEVDRIRRTLEYESNIATAAPAATPASTSAVSATSAPVAASPPSTSSAFGGAQQRKATAGASTPYNELPVGLQATALKAKVKAYSHKVYSKYTVESTELRTAIVCQRENSFYVDTVRAFRDRRYEYKIKGKAAKRAVEAAEAAGDVLQREAANDRLLVLDSLQLAHKCILNSFYGYVMRRGARWQSIEMAGVVTNTGAELIKEARELIDDIGRPLELDTDGIWCLLPSSFPDSFELLWADGGSSRWSFPCSLLNESVAERYTNPQYQELKRREVEPGATAGAVYYEQRSECSILFEVDGPYRAMVLPAAREEGRNIKKRYAVFAQDGAISELKGFEIKRRGELKLIKLFQAALFDRFLHGSSLQQCYAAVGAVCNHWLDVLLSRGEGMEEDDVLELISESKSMSDTVDDYGDRRSTSISTARRLADFLGPDILADRGLNCTFVIAARPEGASTSDRAIPTAIFAADEPVKRRFLRLWLKDASMEDFDVRSLLDWAYYVGRLSAAIQKIVTIPAAMQRVPNPVDRVRHPDWLHRRVREREEAHKQRHISSFFDHEHQKQQQHDVMDIEDVGTGKQPPSGSGVVRQRRKTPGGLRVSIEEAGDKDEQQPDNSAAVSVEATADPHHDGDDDGDVMIIDPEPALPQQDEAKQGEENDTEAVAAPGAADDAFAAWLTSRKQEWKAQKERRKKHKHDAASASANASAFPTASAAAAPSTSAPSLAAGLHSYLRHSTTSLLSTPWQIIQITPEMKSASSAPSGLYRLWVLLQPAALTSVTVRADRLFLLNSRMRLSGHDAHRAVERTLPRGRRSAHLYEMRVDEREWRDKEREYQDALRDDRVEGLYETHVSPLFRLICDLGCVCRATRPPAGSEFDAQQLQYRTTTECGYLQSPALYKGFLYGSLHATAAGGQRGVWCLFFEQSVDVLVVVLNSFGGDRETVNVARLFRLAWREMKCRGRDEGGMMVGQSTAAAAAVEGEGDDDEMEAETDDADIPKHTFTVRHAASGTEAYGLLRESLQRHKGLSSHPTVLLVQAPLSLPLLYLQLPSLRADFPVVCIPHHTQDGAYPTFGWTTWALSAALLRYLHCADWWLQHVALCRWAHVPIGNLEADAPCQLLDVMYARSLTHAKHALWTSRGGGAEVEVGGRWLEEERLMLDDDADGSGRLVVNSSGCYRSTCYELTMQRLAVNAVLQSSEIDDESGVTEQSAAGQDDDAVARAFAILKRTLLSLYQDCVRHSNAQADLLLQHFHRWLQSPLSCLSEPLLYAHVAGLMQRLYTSLLSRLALLGSTIVHASPHRVILCTKKRDAAQAAQYVSFILATLAKRPVYALLAFQPTRRWAALLWLDEYNNAGLPVADDQQERHFAVAVEGEAEPEVISSWQMADYLPLPCRQWLLILIRRYLLQPYLHQLQHKHGDAQRPAAADEGADGCCRSALLSLLRHLEAQLYSVLQSLNRPPSEPSAVLTFPSMAGQHLAMSSPALELSKQMCAVLALDASTSDEVRRVRERLLKLLSVNAWSAAAAFVNPCRAVVLRDLVCAYCNLMRDVDLCRNNHAVGLIATDDADGAAAGEGLDGRDGAAAAGAAAGERRVQALYCEQCHHQYDARVVEERLMRRVRQRLLRYTLQDLVCVSCGSQADRYLQRRCDCSGDYRPARNDGGRAERQIDWRVLHAVCLHYGYYEAAEMVALVLRMEDGLAASLDTAEPAVDSQPDIDADAAV